MKHLTTSLNEARNAFRMSDDETKNFIFNYFNDNYKMIWKNNEVDALIEHETDESVLKNFYFPIPEFPKTFDDIYVLKIINDGESLQKNHTTAQIVYHGNNTQRRWIIIRNRLRFNVYFYERADYGGTDTFKLIGTFYNSAFSSKG